MSKPRCGGRGVVVPTPHIDRIASQGVLCTRAYATSPVCSPCRAAMITGRYPHSVGVPTNDKILDRSVPSLADRLNDAGYRSGFIGKWHLGGTGKPEWAPKVDGGFQFTKYMFNRGHWKKFVMEDGVPRIGAQRKGKPSYDVDGADEKTFSTDFLTDRGIDFMTDDQQTQQPFFLAISYPDPHGPNTVRAPYDHRFDELPFEPPRTYRREFPTPQWLSGKRKHEVFRGESMSRYFGMVQCIDDNIGRIVSSLQASGAWDKTLVLITSDHGDLCYEHDRLNKGNPYEGSARVPMILRLPGKIKPGQIYRDPMGSVDITPTVTGMLGLVAHKDDHGRDLSAVLSDSMAANRDSSEAIPVTFLRNAGVSTQWVAAVDARYKLIVSVNDDPWLFDAQQDPDELLNFYGRPGTADIAQRLASALRDYGSRVRDPHLSHEKITASIRRILGEN